MTKDRAGSRFYKWISNSDNRKIAKQQAKAAKNLRESDEVLTLTLNWLERTSKHSMRETARMIKKGELVLGQRAPKGLATDRYADFKVIELLFLKNPKIRGSLLTYTVEHMRHRVAQAKLQTAPKAVQRLINERFEEFDES